MTITSPLTSGSRLYRHVVALASPVDPVAAAAALRTAGRVMLTSASNAPAVLAVGELAVLSHPNGSGHAPLADAVNFLAGLDIPEESSLAESAWYGLLGYDAVRDFERLPSRHTETSRPVYEFFLPETLIQFADGHARVIGRGASATAARAAAERVVRALDGRGAAPHDILRVGTGRFSFGYDEYVAAVHRAKRHILDGDVFQLVLSIAWTAPATVDSLSVYHRLTVINPSPYHFWYAGPSFEAVGASPEPCLTLLDGQALIRPLAGTRPRGQNSLADELVEEDLRSSIKDLAEHRMLVDLARNDLGRVCRPGSVSVDRLMDVERYSHVMHLTSDVHGQTGADRRTDELIRATFPAGTMTGTPKVRAMQIIDDLEPTRRWLYSGAVGSFGLSHVDLFLTIRSMVLSDGEVRLQAGGGIVHDSEPADEYAECLAKLGSGARALGVTLKGAAA